MQTKQGELTFNTGRGYAPDGQRIHATIIDDTEVTLRVRFSDKTRGIDGEVQVLEFTETAIMREYDSGNYTEV
ncbi:hypothetical protein AB4559_18410 [Vibrio sp. 10N.222.51.C8]|jgi:hypothetical protein|uniref:Uncharacterized protein n=2 Tax=Vibrio cyclitrophicus TaxID=47951 RepID=A0A7Z1MLE1_9VIBR|nr:MULTISPECIES: hypothetical protein [Vibrio]MDA0155444.1 hypothetical protein [Vibrio sp. Makdt]PMP21878.1 hypothetical protein BCS91_19065 [Vibrio cyclitrophicus]PMP31568.1 hypothetical protein BCS90_11285 [Vibrio cyclitrophicus]TKG09956.1 hypothetical protein FCV67_05710 [Vibrio sp. F13]